MQLTKKSFVSYTQNNPSYELSYKARAFFVLRKTVLCKDFNIARCSQQGPSFFHSFQHLSLFLSLVCSAPIPPGRHLRGAINAPKWRNASQRPFEPFHRQRQLRSMMELRQRGSRIRTATLQGLHCTMAFRRAHSAWSSKRRGDSPKCLVSLTTELQQLIAALGTQKGNVCPIRKCQNQRGAACREVPCSPSGA